MKDIKHDLLQSIKGMVSYWANVKDQTVEQKCDGVAFSILVALDGFSGGTPPFEVRPLDEEGKAGEDIAGTLHDEYAALG